MIAHISIGVRDVERSKRFYDAVLEPLGYKLHQSRQKANGLRLWSRQYRFLGGLGRLSGSGG
jgi:catechol 2,3-dioxygenase-like lactoylglutathione lyase family enzyme